MSWVEVPFPVPPDKAGSRLDAYLAARLRRYSRAEVQRLIRAGRVSLSAREAKASARVAAGETVIVRYPRRVEEPPRHEKLPVLYEDEQLLVLNKPGDLLTHPTDKVVANTVTGVLGRQFPGLKLHTVHRLDRETSGVLLLAKSRAAARSLYVQFSGGSVRKEYLAIVRGRVPFARRLVRAPIGREGLAIKVRQAVLAGAGQQATTRFVRLDANEGFSLIRALPGTGRLHQIRVHLAWLGHPVLGDKLYTGQGEMYWKAIRGALMPDDLAVLGAPRQMLHAERLSLRHPATGGPVSFRAPLPEDFQAASARCGLLL